MRDRERARLVGVRDGDEGRPAARQGHARGRLRLGEGCGEVARDPHHLPRGAHLDAEHGVGALEAVERQHGLLDRHVLALAETLAALGQVHVGELLPQHDAAGQLGQRQPHRLGDERDRARGAGICLDHRQLPRVHGELDVHQSAHPDRE